MNLLSEKAIPRCYYPPYKHITHCELHGFCDASQKAYSGVIYLRMTDSEGKHHSSIVVAKTKVAPIRKLTIPKLELCGAALVTRLIQHASTVLEIPTDDVYLWTDSTIVLSWLSINPRKPMSPTEWLTSWKSFLQESGDMSKQMKTQLIAPREVYYQAN